MRKKREDVCKSEWERERERGNADSASIVECEEWPERNGQWIKKSDYLDWLDWSSLKMDLEDQSRLESLVEFSFCVASDSGTRVTKSIIIIPAQSEWKSEGRVCRLVVNVLNGCHHPGGSFIHCALATYLTSKAKVLQTNTSHTWTDIEWQITRGRVDF